MKRTEASPPPEAGTAKRQKCDFAHAGATCGDRVDQLPSADGDKVSNVSKDVKPATVITASESSKSVDLAKEAEYWRKAKKMVLLLSYSGKGYLGMQRNPGCRTIEEDLLQALYKARAIPEQGLREQQSVWFQRAARTDKGVSAAKQSVSLKMVAEEGVLDTINGHLPPQIRVFGMKRVTKKFDAKLQCCARTYLYMSPTFAFCPLDCVVSEEYRIADEVLAEVNRLFGKYVGTHNYHNFTSRRKPSDPSNNRYIMSMSCSKPFVKRDVEFVVVTVKGQSFMLHQIRKMVGLVMAVSRGLAAETVFERAWSQDRIDLPVAPALGLMLNEVHYDRYNKRFGSSGCKTHEDVEWSAQDSQVEEFKHKYIYPDMVDTELEEKPMLAWLGTLGLHTFDIRAGDITTDEVPNPPGTDVTSSKPAPHQPPSDTGENQSASAGDGSEQAHTQSAGAETSSGLPQSSKSDVHHCPVEPANGSANGIDGTDSAVSAVLPDAKKGDS